jgi:hypothetical protein
LFFEVISQVTVDLINEVNNSRFRLFKKMSILYLRHSAGISSLE